MTVPHLEDFIRPSILLTETDRDETVRSIIDLIQFNATKNPHHCFCLQAEEKTEDGSLYAKESSWNVRQITFKDLYLSLKACVSWLKASGIGNSKASSSKNQSPVAVYIESDVSLFIYVVALTALNCSVVLLSARLSSESISHLLRETDTRHLLVSKRTHHVVKSSALNDINVTVVVGYSHFMSDLNRDAEEDTDAFWRGGRDFDENDNKVLILHSSGTTGLPKPIRQGHRYLLGYAACHDFPVDAPPIWPNLSTLPLYHGFGMLAPCLSLSVGMPCCFPPATIIPGAQSTLKLLSLFEAQSLMSVPSIMEDILNIESKERGEALSILAKLKFVAIGGGPLPHSVGEELSHASVNVLAHYGVTEIGALAPIFVPGPDYDWRYIRLRNDLNLQLRPVEPLPLASSVERFKLVGLPFGWGKEYEIQDEIERRPSQPNKNIDIKVMGRRDDIIVLQTGEKISPKLIEDALVLDPFVKSAICLGDGCFELLILIEPSSSVTFDDDSLRKHVWGLLTRINPALDSHARISCKEAIIIKSHRKIIPRSDKGSVMRREVHKLFETDIKNAQRKVETTSYEEGLFGNPSEINEAVKRAVCSILSDKLQIDELSSEEDLFERGMDSLQATRLARALSSIFSSLSPTSKAHITKEFVYQNSSVNKLVSAYKDLARARKDINREPKSRRTRINALATEYMDSIHRDEVNILLTGSSGNLGVQLLSRLVKSQRIDRVYCLCRGGDRAVEEYQELLQTSIKTADVLIDPSGWDKIEIIGVNMQAPRLGLTSEQYTKIINSITHIVHLAWPMDFNRKLESYKPQLDALQMLIKLSCDINQSRPNTKPLLLFASSIAVTRYYHELTGRHVVLERSLKDPTVSASFGYAEAKWICEHMLERAWKTLRQSFDPVVMRIGQLSGPESCRGVWKTAEHVPALLKASQRISAFPALDGDFSWLPVDRAASSIFEVLLHKATPKTLYYHLENPIRQSFADLGTIVVKELNLKDGKIPFEIWLTRVTEVMGDASLIEFFRKDFRSLANGEIKLDTGRTRGVSRSLRSANGLGKDLITEYIQRWREMGFLS
ncbi:acetyl-CoA synthetase-like protein [Patellaria atrata CBS 101060]|uniref:Acetyl-CoA synthetase-like protein n=1 Tax=Patellaria atrata CBS 101060 TaxID=1346257 RepID=A0A9P4VNU8_9PEZI|nr:acetyl-CoA synthetase-like protein [Patellaria atrata CBS 101060]